jgi:hypothetical protein
MGLKSSLLFLVFLQGTYSLIASFVGWDMAQDYFLIYLRDYYNSLGPELYINWIAGARCDPNIIASYHRLSLLIYCFSYIASHSWPVRSFSFQQRYVTSRYKISASIFTWEFMNDPCVTFPVPGVTSPGANRLTHWYKQ